MSTYLHKLGKNTSADVRLYYKDRQTTPFKLKILSQHDLREA